MLKPSSVSISSQLPKKGHSRCLAGGRLTRTTFALRQRGGVLALTDRIKLLQALVAMIALDARR